MDERKEARRPSTESQKTTGSRTRSSGRRQKPDGGQRPKRSAPRSDGQQLNYSSPQQGNGDRKPRRKSGGRAKRRKRNLIIRTFIVLILIMAAIGGFIIWNRYGASSETANLNGYYDIAAADDLAIVVNNTVVGAGGKMMDGVAYIEYETLRQNVNSRFYWDANESVLLYTLPEGNVRVGADSKDYAVVADNKSEEYVILKTEGSTAYIALDFVKQYTNMDCTVSENPNRAMIVTEVGETEVATIKRDTQVRYQAGAKSPILTQVKKSDKVTMIEDEGRWEKVRTSDGFIGYVKDSTLSKAKTETISRDFVEPEYTSISKNHKINMVWNNLENDTANSEALAVLATTKGLTTVSPTWFGIADTAGNLTSIANVDYVNYAHEMKLEVWAMFRDFHDGLETQEDVTAVLSYTSKRENLENQVIAAALQSGIDGINLDFENIAEDCGVHFIQFVREMGVKCRQNGLVFSVDNYVPMSYNAFRDYKEQGIVADYVFIMGYDEHYAGSEEAGSVASYDYVKDGIENMISMVPAEKIVNAIPFYTRLWIQTGTQLTSEVCDMNTQYDALTAAGATAVWDDTTKQNYAEWEADGSVYKIWLEDSSSIEAKMKLIQSEEIAGVAEWRLGYENPEIWNTILQYVN